MFFVPPQGKIQDWITRHARIYRREYSPQLFFALILTGRYDNAEERYPAILTGPGKP
jgi:hypothetical protein